MLTRLARPSSGSAGGSTSDKARDEAVLRSADDRVRHFYGDDRSSLRVRPRLISPSCAPWSDWSAKALALCGKLKENRFRAGTAARYKSRALGELVVAVSNMEPRDLRVPSSRFSTVQEAVDLSRPGDRIALVSGARHADVVHIADGKAVTIWTPGGASLEAVDVRNATLFLFDVQVACCDVGRDVPACSVAGKNASLVVVDSNISSRALLSGVTARDGADLTLLRCTVRGCRESAVFVTGGDTKASLESCVLANSGASGLSVHSGATATASRCQMLDNKENGVHASAAVVHINACACHDNLYNATFMQHGGVISGS